MGDEGDDSVQVAVRMRVFNGRERDAAAKRIVRMTREDAGSRTFIENPDTGEEKEFRFDYSFQSHSPTEQGIGPYATQDTVFEDLGKPVLYSALEGRNVCLFAYGQTGAGKSFSMLGKADPPEMQGIIPRTCREIFSIMDKEKGDPLISHAVGIQVVEIYCEQINDLLADRKTWPPAGHKPRLTKDGYVVDTVCRPCMKYPDIEGAFTFADKNRSVGSHALNPESSRAHTIYQITYERKKKLSAEAKQCETISTRLNLVDLAGSERMELAGTTGQMLKEGNAINLSLTALGGTIKALSEGKRPNFRDSKLTLLLQGSMTNGKVIMIAALSPASICYDESMSTLRFAERIKLVKIKAKKNVSLDPVAEIKKEMEDMRQRMQEEIDDLKRRAEGKDDPVEVANLKKMLEEQKEAERQLRDDYERNKQRLNMSDDEVAAQNAQSAAAISEQWKKALGGASMEDKKTLKVPHLLNLNEDPRLAETLVYAFKKGTTTIGRGDKTTPPDIEFNGMGILKGHCTVEWDGEKKLVIKPASSAAATLINGKRVTDATPLLHNNRVWLGNNYAFRLAFPGAEAEGEKFDSTPDYLFAEEEISKNAAEAAASAGVAGIPSALSHKISEALKKVEQANIIATDLQRENVFYPKIIKNRQTQEDVVVVQVTLPGGVGELHWTWDKFNMRLLEMVKMWQEWQYATQNDQTLTVRPDTDNPFVDEDYQLLGEADVWLQSLANMIDHDASPSVLAPTGQSIGKLVIDINPLDENGDEGPWDEDRADLDPFVEESEELLNKTIGFIVKVHSVTFDVDIKTGAGQCKYCDTFVRYKINPDDDAEPYTETGHVKECTIEASYKHNAKHKMKVTPEMLKKLRDGRVVFQVYGKLSTKSFGDAAASTRLPTGWKRVTAFEDPDGKLHHTLPPM
eukprot:PhM_4_TR6952/c0_g1_i1/m.20249